MNDRKLFRRDAHARLLPAALAAALLESGCSSSGGPCLQYSAFAYQQRVNIHGVGSLAVPRQALVCTARGKLPGTTAD